MTRARLVLLLAWVLAIAAACNQDLSAQLAALGEGCLVNSDCDGALVCIHRRCSEQCADSGDCPPGQRCVIGEPPIHVCRPPVPCTLHSDCPAPQICGIDGQCRDACLEDRDCLAGQICTDGVCADESELDDGKLPNPDGNLGEGAPCTVNSECQDPLICLAGSCLLICIEDGDCPASVGCEDFATCPVCIDNVCQTPTFVPPCVPGQQQKCDCGDGNEGVQTCTNTNPPSWGDCAPCGARAVPPEWTCDDALWGDGDCHCGCGFVDLDCPDMAASSCDDCNAPGSCHAASQGCQHIDNGNSGTCAVPPAWSCQPDHWADGICDCGCGFVDIDCASPAVSFCQECSLEGSCDHGNGCADINPNDSGLCEAPVGWTCGDATFGDGTCHCGCGVQDVDCPNGDASACQECNAPGACDASGSGCPGSAIAAGDNSQCAPPAGWACMPSLYADGLCDCGCGVVDLDCADALLSSCDTCNAINACDQSGNGCLNSAIDPNDNSSCMSPPGFSCGDAYADGVCDCGCGVLDLDCAGIALTDCDVCGSLGSCDPSPDCGNTTIAPNDNSVCIPPGWTCAPDAFIDGQCHCGCGIVDPDCPDTLASSCSVCGSVGACSGDPGCGDIPDSDNTLCVPPGWSCGTGPYSDGVCNCGCAVIDVDCPDLLLTSCALCNAVGSCSISGDCSEIDPNDNRVCFTPFFVTDTNPDGITPAPTVSMVKVTFNQPADITTVNETTLTLEIQGHKPSVPWAPPIFYMPNGLAVDVVLPHFLPRGATVDAAVTSGVLSDPTGTAATPYNWSFTTLPAAFTGSQQLDIGTNQAADMAASLNYFGDGMVVYYSLAAPNEGLYFAPFDALSGTLAAPSPLFLTPEFVFELNLDFAGDGTAVLTFIEGGSMSQLRGFYFDGFGWDAGTILSSGDFPSQSSMAVDDAGNVMVVWSESDGTRGRIRSRIFERGMAAWTPVLPVEGSAPPLDNQDPRVVHDGPGEFTAVWTQDDGGGNANIMQNHYGVAGWDSEGVLVDVLDPVIHPRITTWGMGQALLTYERQVAANLVLEAIRRTDGAWDATNPDIISQAASQLQNREVVADREGNAAAYYAVPPAGFGVTYDPVNGWGPQQQLAATNDPRAAVNLPGPGVGSMVLVVGDQAATHRYDVASGMFQSPVVHNPGGDTNNAAMAVDPSGRVLVVWNNSAGDLLYEVAE